MTKLILASASPHRKKLLKLLGVPFRVKTSQIQEIFKAKANCADLVKMNALLKARDVARRLKEGIVIGADTLVEVGNKKIVGKPRDLAHAKRMLKEISRRPQSVFTGVAIIDARTKKEMVDFEKTTIEMYPLSDKEIDDYYRHVSPLDKSGGFEIQHRGALYLKRIEGCYFNVVGLPIARLYRMLKKFGVLIMMAFVLQTFSGCAPSEYNLATGKEEQLIYGTDKEIALGEAMARQVEKQEKILPDMDVNERVRKILERLVAVCDRKDIIYSIKVIDDDKVNAVSLPGGYIYVFKGLIEKVENDDQLASVIAHEVGHITARHSIKKIQSLYGYSFLKVLTAVTVKKTDVSQGLDLAFASIFTEYSREDEFLADRLGIKYAQKAGYHPEGMPAFLKILGKVQEKEPASQYNYWRTHPYISQRISAANQEVTKKLEFRDYINLIGEK